MKHSRSTNTIPLYIDARGSIKTVHSSLLDIDYIHSWSYAKLSSWTCVIYNSSWVPPAMLFTFSLTSLAILEAALICSLTVSDASLYFSWIQLLLGDLVRTLRLSCSGIGGFLCLSGGRFCVTVCLVLQVGCSLTDLRCGVATGALGVLVTLGRLVGQITSGGLGGVGHTCKASSSTKTEDRKIRRQFRQPIISYIQARLA